MAKVLTHDAISAFFRIAGEAIKNLDGSLRLQFSGAQASCPEFRLHPGVLSIGREPILVWEIFRALLGAGYCAGHGIEVRWEHKYPRVRQREGPTRHMDLAFGSDSDDDDQRLIGCIEAKGFNDRLDDLRTDILLDIEKMLELDSDVRLFALAFSYAKNMAPLEVLRWWKREERVEPRPEWHFAFETWSLEGPCQACVTLLEVRRDR